MGSLAMQTERKIPDDRCSSGRWAGERRDSSAGFSSLAGSMSGWWLVAVAACGGSAVIVAFGIIGLMRDGDYLIDMMVFYIAGEWHWLDVNPYGHKNTPGHLAEQGLYYRSYSYPPHFAPFTMGLALLPYRSAEVVVTVFNLAASAAIVVATVSLCGLARRPTTLQVAAITFFVLCNPFGRSEEHTSELQSLMRISYAVFCLKKKQLYHIIS